MLGAVAIMYFFAAAFVMAIACSGPDTRAKFASAYLMCAWAGTNFISTRMIPDEALAAFSPWDISAAMVFYIVLLCWPSRWLALMLAALTVQVIFQVRHALLPPAERSIVASHAVNEAMWIVQLVAPTIPSIAQLQRRIRRARARRKIVIPPPYDGWEPPKQPAIQTPPHEPWQSDEITQG